jgi:phosphoheptose isomerase
MMRFNLDEYFSHIASVLPISDELEGIISILEDCQKKGGTIFVVGCGGSASTATHFAADLAKTCGGFKAISLVDNIPLVSAYTNDCGWESIFEGQLENWITNKDVLVGFSVHGGNSKWSGNLTKAMNLAKKRGAKIIGFAGFDGGTMAETADACFVVPINDEIYGTPVVEAIHVVVNHGIVFELKRRLNK